MKPNSIRNAADAGIELLQAHGRGTPEAFILTWIAWEGLKFRLLVVALTKMGWAVGDVEAAIEKVGITTNEHYKRVFRGIFSQYPSSTKGVSQNWNKAEKYRAIRNRYVHGAKGASPSMLLEATEFLHEITVDVAWLSGLKVDADGEMHKIGNVYRRQNTSKRRSKSRSALENFLQESKNQNSGER